MKSDLAEGMSISGKGATGGPASPKSPQQTSTPVKRVSNFIKSMCFIFEYILWLTESNEEFQYAVRDWNKINAAMWGGGE